ncbi:ABC transporter substrate-binding protein [Actinomycetes bacterium M1A6_2h]
MPVPGSSKSRSARYCTAATAFAVALSVAACSSPGSGAEQVAALPAADPAQTLSDVCPATIGVQVDWEPEAEHGPLYNLVGAGYTVDSDGKSVTGPLVIGGKDTGVKIKIQAGGAAIGFQSVSSQLYVDDSLMLGTVTTDGAISGSKDQPVTAVAAMLKKSPQILMWDPATHPGWNTIADIGKTDASVVVNQGNVFAPLLVKEGQLKQSQIDTGYDGSPARFVGDPSIAQQGYATAEPYTYENEIGAWNKPIKYALIADQGYNVYPQAISVRSDKLQENSACLKKLVPIIQQSTMDYLSEPSTANATIVDLVKQYNDGWVYSEGVANFGATQLKEGQFMGPETGQAVGYLDPARVQGVIDTFVPILESSGASLKPGLTASDISTDQFLDQTIGK